MIVTRNLFTLPCKINVKKKTNKDGYNSQCNSVICFKVISWAGPTSDTV